MGFTRNLNYENCRIFTGLCSQYIFLPNYLLLFARFFFIFQTIVHFILIQLFVTKYIIFKYFTLIYLILSGGKIVNSHVFLI